jgi:cobalamin biosynthesis protein CbiG
MGNREIEKSISTIDDRGRQKTLWLGFGCRQGISQSLITTEIDHILRKYRLPKQEIIGVATIDLKAKEASLQAYCRDNNFELKIFSATELKTVKVPYSKAIVRDKIGTPSVAEAASILAALLYSPQAILVVPKQILPGKGTKVMTIAVARSIF